MVDKGEGGRGQKSQKMGDIIMGGPIVFSIHWKKSWFFIIILGYVLHDNNHDCKEGGCKHEISTSNGDISSPHYPDYYPAKKDCVWVFTTTPGHRIKLVSIRLLIGCLLSCVDQSEVVKILKRLPKWQQYDLTSCLKLLPH